MTKVRDVMTPEPVVLPASASVQDAARAMRDADIGNVLVSEGGRPGGLVTDRDLVVRALADGRFDATLGEIRSGDLVTVSPDDELDAAVRMMEQYKVRRVAVCDREGPVGVLSLGDVATVKDPESALGQISSAPPNN